MAETNLTKRIKLLTHHYSPKIKSDKRTIRWADEVWTPTGIVDSIRFEDYYYKDEYLCRLIDIDSFSEEEKRFSLFYNHELGKCFRDKTTIKNKIKCHGCIWRIHKYIIDMMITCFEVKISLSDFRSKNGHNFHGNENYYCIPKSIVHKIENEIPNDIGVIVYYEGKKANGLRKYRPAKWHNVDNETKVLLLYNAMKKWCDSAVFINK